ncbi:hypothetical protein [Gluconobacter cerinus]|uniref:Phage protein n=1 Tax=Gluconobacter cerinus TaxID=38307 RepID=A0AAV5NAN3_9PROT|nr:hypothetical protein [Gluconobacter cerinus]GBR03181.1 hypothetical protein AA0229_1880 [Gluconobacter cerinus NRIC 0229]GLQ61561.1 hypothetical protein GCM10007867_04060 [Gluconobacter cerinus]
MPIDLKVGLDAKALQRDLSALAEKEIPKAAASALNRLATGARLQVVDRMREVFDRPSAFTLNGFFTRPATGKNLEAWVATRDYARRGTAAITYLGPQIHGGDRDMKRFEKALRSVSGGQYVVPGKDCPLDENGNIKRGVIIQILSRMSLMQDPTSNIGDKTARRIARQLKNVRGSRSEYFVGYERGNRRPRGIFKLLAKGQVGEILRFVSAPHYKARLPVEEIVNETISRRQDRIVNEEIIKVFRKRGLR